MNALTTILDKGIEPLRWLIVIGIAYTLAMTILVFFQTPVSAPVAETPTSQAAAPERPKANVNAILSKHLFGEAGAAAPQQEVVAETSVATRLPLDLQSVFVASDPARSTAIVAQRGKPGQLYRIGDKLPGNAELVAVEHEQIYLRRAGVRESLAFPELRSSNLTTRQVRPVSRNTRRDVPARVQRSSAQRDFPDPDEDEDDLQDEYDDPQEVIDEYREQFAEDAEGTLNDLGIEATEEGGYRIGDSAQSALLRRTGLQNGDVILSINGQAVGDLQQDQLQIDNILAQGSARIEVQRGARRFFITATLPQQP